MRAFVVTKIQGGFPMDEQAASSLRVEWLADLGKIQALRRDWMDLESKVRDRTVYVTHDYVVSWYKGYGGTRYTAFGKPLVGAVWDGSTLVGVAPFIACRPTFGKVPVRRLDFAGYNLQAGEFLSWDGRSDVLVAIIYALAERLNWDVLCLNNIQADSERAFALQQAAERCRLAWEVTDDHSYAVADLRQGYEAYAKLRGSNFRKQVRRHAKKIEQAGSWRVDRLDCSRGPGPVAEYLERMFSIADAGWRARERGLAEERNHHPFFRTLVPPFAERGMVDLSILSIGGRDAAFTLALVERGVYFHLLIAFDEDMSAYSPGSFLLQEVFRLLPTLDIHFVVSHGDYEYKRRWASEFVNQKRFLLFSRTLRGRLSHLWKFRLERIWNRVRPADRPVSMPGSRMR
jgi:CelD/BcsL family acetyltransferase involved in cellulose biosynthesis